MSSDEWLSVRRAAEYTGYSVHTISDAARIGDLAAAKKPTPGGRGQWRFRIEDLDAWLSGELVADGAA